MTQFPSFDELRKMAEESPEKLDALLEAETARILDAVPPHLKDRMNGLQFQIEAQRRISKNPVDRLVRIFRMMNESFLELNEALSPFRSQREANVVSVSKENAMQADVLSFPAARKVQDNRLSSSK